MISRDDIRSIDWQPKLGAPGEVVEGLYDINQCIRIILTTPRGTDPHRPLFGSDIWRWLDAPVGEAIPQVVREVVDALQAWEPRISLVSVVPEISGERVTIRVEWTLRDGVELYRTEVTINGDDAA